MMDFFHDQLYNTDAYVTGMIVHDKNYTLDTKVRSNFMKNNSLCM